jgi:hypothetical protein
MSSEERSDYLVVPYEPRPVRFLGSLETRGWSVKAYSLAAPGRRHDAGAIGTALARAGGVLPEPYALMGAEQNYGLALMIAHFDAEASRYLIGWWIDDGLLHQRLFAAPAERPGGVLPAKDFVLSVHDIALLDGERRLFVKHMMARSGADRRAYLAARVTGEV